MSGPNDVAEEASSLHSRHECFYLWELTLSQKDHCNGVLLMCSSHLLWAARHVTILFLNLLGQELPVLD